MSESSEITTYIKTWMIVYACLVYAYATGKLLPPGKVRALFISPVTALFLLLPLGLTSVTLCAVTGMIFSWLATFKLALFAFGKGPLASDYPTNNITFSRFLAIASLPIMLSSAKSKVKEIRSSRASLLLTLKVFVFAMLYKIYSRFNQDGDDQLIHPILAFLIHGTHICLSMEFVAEAFRVIAGAILDLELDPVYDEPLLLSTSVQNFWGRRWNLAVSSVLRASVYDPVRKLLTSRVGSKHARRSGVLAAFATSAVMHELIFYYLSRKRPTWELSLYFLLHGLTVVVETDVKRWAEQKKWRLPRIVSIVLTMTFVPVTSLWLISPQIHRCNGHVRAAEEFAASVAFLRSLIRI